MPLNFLAKRPGAPFVSLCVRGRRRASQRDSFLVHQAQGRIPPMVVASGKPLCYLEQSSLPPDVKSADCQFADYKWEFFR